MDCTNSVNVLNHWFVHVKQINCLVCELYLNKTDNKKKIKEEEEGAEEEEEKLMYFGAEIR